MEKLVGVLRAYPWGSRTLLAALRGDRPSADPEAEIWFGAHPADPSCVAGKPLNEFIGADHKRAMGERVTQRFPDGLPFLLKLLAAREPLSLQAHPTSTQAVAGFAEENAQGIPLDSPKRNYKDPHSKPELLVAITPFEAMAGFRPIERIVELFDVLACPPLDHYRPLLFSADPTSDDALRAIFTTWITIPEAHRRALIDRVVESAQRVIAERTCENTECRYILRNIVDIARRYPGDVGVLGALLLNHVRLAPGEAIYLEAAHLHAYLCGLGVEIMANSDNVLRGGLTSKHVDVPELVKVLRFDVLSNPFLIPTSRHPQGSPVVVDYPVPVEEFQLRLLRYGADDSSDARGEEYRVDHDGPVIVLCACGHATMTQGDGHDTLTLDPTEAAWISASDAPVIIQASPGSQIYIASA